MVKLEIAIAYSGPRGASFRNRDKHFDAPNDVRYACDMFLCRRSERATIEAAAAGLAVGPRTLQRRLSAAGTRFGTELAHAKVVRARRLMRDPARRLSDVALEVGCATPSAFSDLYRRMTGESPSQWRRRSAME